MWVTASLRYSRKCHRNCVFRIQSTICLSCVTKFAILVYHKQGTTIESITFFIFSLRPVRSGDLIPVGTKFSAPVQTGPGDHPNAYKNGTGAFPRVKRLGRGIDHPPHLVPKLRKEYSYTYTSYLGLLRWNLPSPLLEFVLLGGKNMEFSWIQGLCYALAYLWILFGEGGGVQQIHLRTEDRNLGAVVP